MNIEIHVVFNFCHADAGTFIDEQQKRQSVSVSGRFNLALGLMYVFFLLKKT